MIHEWTYEAMAFDLLSDTPALHDNVFVYDAETQGGACSWVVCCSVQLRRAEVQAVCFAKLTLPECTPLSTHPSASLHCRQAGEEGAHPERAGRAVCGPAAQALCRRIAGGSGLAVVVVVVCGRAWLPSLTADEPLCGSASGLSAAVRTAVPHTAHHCSLAGHCQPDG